jgi:SAM-dependent methyltransferase
MQSLAASRGIDFREGSAYGLPFPDATFGLITCIEVIEHLERPFEGLAEVRRVLAPGGFAIITTPVPKASWRLLWWGWTTFGPGKKWKHTPHVADVDLWDGSSTADGLDSMLRRIGMRIEASDRCNLGFIAGARISEVQ